MEVAFVIWQCLAALGREQRDLARAAEVTESYIKPLKFKGKRPTALSYYREWQNLRDACICTRHSRRAGASAMARTQVASRSRAPTAVGGILRHVLVIKTRRARRKSGDIRQLLLPQHRAESRGD